MIINILRLLLMARHLKKLKNYLYFTFFLSRVCNTLSKRGEPCALSICRRTAREHFKPLNLQFRFFSLYFIYRYIYFISPHRGEPPPPPHHVSALITVDDDSGTHHQISLTCVREGNPFVLYMTRFSFSFLMIDWKL